MHRRQALFVLGSGVAAFSAYRYFGNAGMAATGVKWPRALPDQITPPSLFYTVSKNKFFDPEVDAARWRLDLHGLVARPASLSLDDLRALPVVEQQATLACVGNAVPARAIGNARWRGVRLRDVLAAAGGVDRSARDVVFISADNYTDSIPLRVALDPDTLLAFEMNGAPLPAKHGAPLRAIVPGIYGMKNAKWIEAIEVVDVDFQGYWQRQGWSDVADYQTLSRFDLPRDDDELPSGQPTTLGGIAFAGTRGIARVEVGVAQGDGAWQWHDATLAAKEGPSSWQRWAWTWPPAAPGRYRLAVRATDGTGALQPETPRDAFPAGSHGWHRISVSVSA